MATTSPSRPARAAGRRRSTAAAAALLVLAGTVGLAGSATATADPAEAGTADLRADLAAILADPALAAARAGVLVRSAETGEVLYDNDASSGYVPASNEKLLIAAAALDVLGPDHTFTTSALAESAPRRGRVEDLYLVGTGDPSTDAAAYGELAAQVAEAGVRRVTGDVVADDSWFDSVRLGTDWAWDDEPYYYSAQISALTVAANDDLDTGAITVVAEPGAAAGEPARVGTDPATDYVTVTGEVATGAPGSAPSLSVTREHGTNTVSVSGSVPAGGSAATGLASVWEPTGYAAELFADALAEHGVRVDGEVRRGTAPEGTAELAVRESAPLSELLPYFMKLSNNGHAEILVKAMGREVSGEGSWPAGLAATRAALERIGMPVTPLQLRDGSGLSRANLVSPEQITELLIAIDAQPWAEHLHASLPVAGEADRMVGGTLRNRMRGTAAAGNVTAKTGTLTSVSALSGYVTSADGERLVFSVLNNNHIGFTPTAIQDAIAVRLAEFSRTEPTAGRPSVAEPSPLRATRPLPGVDADSVECSWIGAC
ncbi:D-alanyl-D-alanine carboxypeptidase/D-alanyl-D-alanine endopeptidase [Allonocardiopsis opalescens]|nr:D-alanyl-D-alanine carboxypeptidase/D-alanyl-D-alanine-endopeptidase [Allonocardiopsis opalescens]